MIADLQTKLLVNETPVDLNEFAHQYVTSIVICAVSLLKGGENVKYLVFNLENQKPKLKINDKVIPLSPFPRDALVGTFTGMVSSLKGVNGIDRLRIEIKAK